MPGDAVYGFALIAIAAWIGLIYVVKLRPSGSVSRSRPGRYYRTRSLPGKLLVPDLSNPGQQLNAVMAAPFKKRKLLSREEFRVFKIAVEEAAAARRGHRVFAQTSLGEILRSPDDDAFHSINSKRAYILMIDPWGCQQLAVED